MPAVTASFPAVFDNEQMTDSVPGGQCGQTTEKDKGGHLRGVWRSAGSQKLQQITVREIIDLVDVGRTTFYAHFETKDDLLRNLCAELFDHIMDSAADRTHTHGLYSDGDAPKSVFCHLLQHLEKNDNNILGLLSCESNELFLRYFKDSLNQLLRVARRRLRDTEPGPGSEGLPHQPCFE